MHKKFYASGFLYCPRTQQILLQQKKQTRDAKPIWSLIEAVGKSREDPQVTFQRVMKKLLHIKLRPKAIQPVYSYKNIDQDRHILYAETKKMKNYSRYNGIEFGWFTFKQVLKLHADEQIKHDIVVAQRVIDSKTRKRLGQHTLE